MADTWYCAGLLYEEAGGPEGPDESTLRATLVIFRSPEGAEWNVARAIGQTQGETGSGGDGRAFRKVVDVRPLTPSDRIVDGGEVYSMALTGAALADLRERLELDR